MASLKNVAEMAEKEKKRAVNMESPTRILSLSPREIDPKRSSPLGWQYNSIIKGYGEEYDDAKTGDMIMATASDINHPAYLTGKVGMMYIVFGVVRCFVYCDYDTGKGDDEWDGVVKDQECLEVKWANVPGNGNVDWDVPPPPND